MARTDTDLIYQSQVWLLLTNKYRHIKEYVEGNLALTRRELVFTPKDSTHEVTQYPLDTIRQINLYVTGTMVDHRIHVKQRNPRRTTTFSLYEKNRLTDIVGVAGKEAMDAAYEWDRAFKAAGVKINGLRRDIIVTTVLIIVGIILALILIPLIKKSM